MTLEERICGSLLLGAIGDCIGNHALTSSQPFVLPLTENSGRFSCATLLTLFTCEGLINGYNRGAASGIASGAEIYVDDSYLNYLHLQGYSYRGAWSRWSDLLHAEDMLGKPQQKEIDCVDVLLTGRSGTLDEPINSRDDCGAVIRCAPVGFMGQFGKRYDDSPDDVAFWQGVKVCALTHGSPSGYIPGGILCDMVRSFAELPGISPGNAFEKAIRKAYFLFPEFSEEINTIGEVVRKALDLSETDSTQALPKLFISSSSAVDMLAAAMFCTVSSGIDPIKAFSVSSQHSTLPNALSSLTGQIIGTVVGIQGIPLALRQFCSEEIVLSIGRQLENAASEMRDM